MNSAARWENEQFIPGTRITCMKMGNKILTLDQLLRDGQTFENGRFATAHPGAHNPSNCFLAH
jgi:hypothetical protein